MNWSPNQITFLLDGVVFYTYNPAVKNADTWPFIADQYLLLNIAIGGVAGTIPGAIYKVEMDDTHPLAFGYNKNYFTQYEESMATCLIYIIYIGYKTTKFVC